MEKFPLPLNSICFEETEKPGRRITAGRLDSLAASCSLSKLADGRLARDLINI